MSEANAARYERLNPPSPGGYSLDTITGEIKSIFDETKLKSISNKDRQFWGRMRQDISLCNRSEKIEESTVDAIRSELSDILDSRIIVYPPTLRKYGLDLNSTYEERKSKLGVVTSRNLPTENEQRFLKTMKYKAEEGRKAIWSWRIAQEAEEKQKLGWYPFFVTLTVDPFHERFSESHPEHREGVTSSEELWKNGREFRLYIRRLVNIVCKELGHRPAHKTNTSESEYVTYAGVIEHGSTREHHHGHFMIWMREIPNDWKQCPNRFIKNPANRINNECIKMRSIWPWSLPGLSKSLYYRTIGDIWSTLGFVVPLKDGAPMKISYVGAAGNYITKYLQKEHKEWAHRMKCTRNLGKKKLVKVLEKMSQKVLEPLTWRPEKWTTSCSLKMIHTVPHELLRSLAKQRLYYLQWDSRQLDLTKLLKNNSGHYPKMLMSVKAGVRVDRMRSQEFYDWLSGHLPEIKGYCEKRLKKSHKRLEKYYPLTNFKKVHQLIAGNNIGLT
jgi:hypothetical protein